MQKLGQAARQTFGISDYSPEALEVVDSSSPVAFRKIARMAGRLLNAPVSLVSIVQEDRDRQYFAGQVGLSEPWASNSQTPLSHSFCQHVKKTNAPLVVSDATQHPQLRDNPAIRDLNVFAYLGVPIQGPGKDPWGALCVIEDKVRHWGR